jgi:hypothetical protein
MQNKQIYKSTNLQIVNKFAFGAVAAFAYLTICLFAYSNKVHAQELQILPLTVIPPKQEVLINPGEKFSTSVKFLNQSDTPITGTLSVLDFIVEDEAGTPLFLDNPQVIGTTQIPAKYSAAQWMTTSQDNLTIAGKGNVSVPVTITVPKGAAPGGRYAAVLFQPSGSLTLGNPTSGQETPIAIRLASLVYIRVAGPITEKATVTEFTGPTFLEYGPIGITTKILNEGNYHITPKGTISLKNMFGQTIGKTDLEAKNIFPGTTRTYLSQLGSKLMIGKFTANLNATYGETGKLLTSTITLWIFPWKIALAVLLAAIIIILSGTTWYRRMKKKEEKLVEALKEETAELAELKEELKDKITGDNIKAEDAPKDETTPKEEVK